MEASLTTKLQDRRLLVAAHGRWTADRAAAIETEIARLGTEAAHSGSLDFDLSGVAEFDTYGVWLLERLRRQLAAAGKSVSLSGIGESEKALFEEMQSVNRDVVAPPAGAGQADPLEEISAGLTRLSHEFGGFSATLGATVVALARAVASPWQFRMTSFVHQFDRVAWQALPIVLLVTLIIGAIIAQQGFFHFSEFGVDLYVIDMIGFLVMREIGVLLVSIIVAGRSGSAFTAELGSMKMREEIDALRTMGLDPVSVLALPRTLALVVALPILAFVGSVAALAGAGLVAVFYAHLSPEFFIDRLRETITLDHLRVGLIKAPFIGLVIGIIATTEGFRVAGSTTSLGRHTTQSVVKSIFMVIVLDGLFALFFSGIGM